MRLRSKNFVRRARFPTQMHRQFYGFFYMTSGSRSQSKFFLSSAIEKAQMLRSSAFVSACLGRGLEHLKHGLEVVYLRTRTARVLMYLSSQLTSAVFLTFPSSSAIVHDEPFSVFLLSRRVYSLGSRGLVIPSTPRLNPIRKS